MYPNLKMAMWRLGIRQNALARQLNLNETVVSKVINGSRKPSPRMRTMLAEFLQQDPEWLFKPARRNGTAARSNGANGAVKHEGTEGLNEGG